jgi:hypothetical protein
VASPRLGRIRGRSPGDEIVGAEILRLDGSQIKPWCAEPAWFSVSIYVSTIGIPNEREATVIKNIFGTTLCIGALALAVVGCNNEPQPLPQLPQAVVPPVVATPVVAPPVVAPPVVTPPPPPETPLLPIEEPVAATPGKGGKGGGGIDKAISGPATTGEELAGNYTCQITSKEFPFGLNPPPSGCRIYKAGDGSMKVGPIGRQGGISGSISDPKAAGFHIVGTYNLNPIKLDIKARMLRQGAGKFSGKGRGVLNGDKSNQISYTLTMTQQ